MDAQSIIRERMKEEKQVKKNKFNNSMKIEKKFLSKSRMVSQNSSEDFDQIKQAKGDQNKTQPIWLPPGQIIPKMMSVARDSPIVILDDGLSENNSKQLHGSVERECKPFLPRGSILSVVDY